MTTHLYIVEVWDHARKAWRRDALTLYSRKVARARRRFLDRDHTRRARVVAFKRQAKA